jgi:hypothetical protein
VFSNTSATSANVYLALDGQEIITAKPVAGNSYVTVPDLHQVLATTKTITAYASSSSIVAHISGSEIT